MPFNGNHDAELELRRNIINAVRKADDLDKALADTSALLAPHIRQSGITLAVLHDGHWIARASVGQPTTLDAGPMEHLGDEHRHVMGGTRADTYVHVFGCETDLCESLKTGRDAVVHHNLRDADDKLVGLLVVSFDDMPDGVVLTATFARVLDRIGGTLARKMTNDPTTDALLDALHKLPPEMHAPYARLLAAMATVREQSQAVLRMVDAGLGHVGVDLGVRISHDGRRVDLYMASDRPDARPVPAQRGARQG